MISSSIQSFIQRKPWRAGALVLACVALVGIVVSQQSGTGDDESVATVPPLVSLTTAAEFSGDTNLRLIGEVRALTEAQVTAERGGRVVRTETSLGATVPAGQVIAILENAAERAAVLQAEGAYEAALAAAALSSIGVSEANSRLASSESNARAAVLSAYNTVNNIVRNSIDDFFANPDARLPGLRIDGKGYTAALNTERVAYQTLLSDWQRETQVLTTTNDLETAISEAIVITGRTIQFVETFLTVFSTQDNNTSYSDAELASFRTSFSAAKSSLITTETALTGSLAALRDANDAKLRAEVSATGGNASPADAQVKQALGVLRSAEANLAKTILTSPISGTVNSLAVKAGDYIGPGTLVAVVANNQALEIITYVREEERERIAIGDTFTIGDTATATVGQIAPALDPATRKIEVRLVTEGTAVKNGDTVTLIGTNQGPREEERVRVPITAIKFQVEDGYMLTAQDGLLVEVPIEVGQISGSAVTVTAGLDIDDSFVVDVRGLEAGERVTVAE